MNVTFISATILEKTIAPAAVALQAGRFSASALKTLLVPTIFVAILLFALIYIVWLIKENQKRNPTAEIDKEFRKERDTLLIMADHRKRERDKQLADEEKQARIREEIGQLSVEMDEFIDTSCPHCLQPLFADTELVVLVEPYVCVHLSCFGEYTRLNPEIKSGYVYSYPSGNFEAWSEFVTGR